MEESKQGGQIRSVEKALRLLNLLAEHERPMSLTELSALCGWPKSTTHGLLATLRAGDYLCQYSDTGYYWLGTRLTELGSLATQPK